MNTLSTSLAAYAPISAFSCRLEFTLGLLFPEVARQGPAQTFTLAATGEAHTVPVAAGTVAVIAEANGDARREPVLAYRVQVFERLCRNGEHFDWYVSAEPFGADGSAVKYDYLETPEGASAYLAELVCEDRDALVREALAGALLMVVDDDEEVDTLDSDDDDCNPDVGELVRARAADASFEQGE